MCHIFSCAWLHALHPQTKNGAEEVPQLPSRGGRDGNICEVSKHVVKLFPLLYVVLHVCNGISYNYLERMKRCEVL